MRVAAIDPGVNGGAAVIELRDGDPLIVPLDVFDLPTLGDGAKREIDDLALIGWLKEWQPDHLYLENVWAMPSRPDAETGERRGMGVSSAFKFGMAFGQIKTCVRGCKIPFTLVAPLKWKNTYGLKGPDKENSRQMAIRLFPDAHQVLKLKKDANKAEALLIARYGLLHGDHARAAA